MTLVHCCDKQAVKKVATDLEKSVEPIDGQKLTKLCQPEVKGMKVSKTSFGELKRRMYKQKRVALLRHSCCICQRRTEMQRKSSLTRKLWVNNVAQNET